MSEIIISFSGWYEAHRRFSVSFTPGVTTLVGKNGSGKSSMINEINHYLKKTNFPVFYYEQREMGRRSASSFGIGGSPEEAATYHCSSEGERIIVTMGYNMQHLKHFLEENKDADMAFVLFDGIDSGLSINLIQDIHHLFQSMIKSYPNLLIINTTNNYEFTKDSRCIIAKNGKDITFNTYDDFVNFITNKNPARKQRKQKKDS